MPTRVPIVAIAFYCGVFTTVAPRLDRRIVDVVEAGNAQSEAAHGYVGEDVNSGMSDGKPYRQARGWMRFALATFDDTEVTIACTFVGQDSEPRHFDVIVEDSLVASRTVAPHDAAVVVDIAVPFIVTKGRTSIAVTLRARGGATPALREIRTIQDHNEFEQPFHFHGVAR